MRVATTIIIALTTIHKGDTKLRYKKKKRKTKNIEKKSSLREPMKRELLIGWSNAKCVNPYPPLEVKFSLRLRSLRLLRCRSVEES